MKSHQKEDKKKEHFLKREIFLDRLFNLRGQPRGKPDVVY